MGQRTESPRKWRLRKEHSSRFIRKMRRMFQSSKTKTEFAFRASRWARNRSIHQRHELRPFAL